MGYHLFQLNPRLQTAAEFVRENARVADIGTDHGYLPIWLVMSGKCPCALGADINEMPLQRAKSNLSRYGVEDKIQLLLCDGLSAIDGKLVDDVVICGMGGELIAHILTTGDWVKDPEKHYILQPMSSPQDLRIFLKEHGFLVQKEVVVQDAGKIYSVLSVVWTGKTEPLEPEFDYVGKIDLAADDASREYGARVLRLLKNLHSGYLSKNESEEAEKVAQIMENIARKMEGTR